MSKKRSICIYGLRDPIDGQIRYVGQSLNPALRLGGHISAARAHRRYGNYLNCKDRWLLRLVRARKAPTLVFLALCKTQPNADAVEAHHIRLRQASLYNAKR